MRGSALLAAAVVTFGSICLWFWWSPPWANELVSGDEGYYGNMARNIVEHGWKYVVGPSLWPGGPPGDKPPVYPAILAASMSALGTNETGVRVPSFVLAAVILLALGFVVGKATGPWSGVAAVALLASLPWFADASRGATAEIATAAFGSMALAVLAPGPLVRWRALLSGTMLGLAFLCKLWLAAPFVLACMAMIGIRRRELGANLAMLVAALAVGAVHGLLVLATAPETAAHWLQIYFGRSLLQRTTGEGYGVGVWVKHPAYYWAIVVHAGALSLPFTVAGVDACLRRLREPAPRAVLVWAAALGILSIFAVKSGIYAYVVVPAWIALAAIGGAALASGTRPSALTVALGLLGTAPWLIPHDAGQRVQVSIWAGSWAAAGVAWLVSARWPRRGRLAATAFILLAAAGGFVRESQRLPIRYHRPGLREVAALVRPYVEDLPPDSVCFVSPEAPALAFYLFHSGTYWTTPHLPWTPERGRALREQESIRVFVVDTTDRLYGGSPDSTTLRWLEASTEEIGGQLGPVRPHGSSLRVFVRSRPPLKGVVLD